LILQCRAYNSDNHALDFIVFPFSIAFIMNTALFMLFHRAFNTLLNQLPTAYGRQAGMNKPFVLPWSIVPRGFSVSTD
jgi:hypothetical protein